MLRCYLLFVIYVLIACIFTLLNVEEYLFLPSVVNKMYRIFDTVMKRSLIEITIFKNVPSIPLKIQIVNGSKKCEYNKSQYVTFAFEM